MSVPSPAAGRQDHPSRQGKVYEQLKQAILTGEIRPGDRLREVQLSRALGVSRIPLREAIRTLEREGLVVGFARRGMYASPLGARDVDEIYLIRAVLEGLSARLAAEHHTPADLVRIDEILAVMARQAERGDSDGLFQTGREFHQAVLDASGNRKLAEITDLMYGQVERIRQVRMRLTRRSRDVYREYRRIRDAIARRDGVRAEAEMRAHVERPRQALKRLFPLAADEPAGAG